MLLTDTWAHVRVCVAQLGSRRQKTAATPIAWNRHLLIGRGRELGRLEELLAAVRAGGTGSLLVVGEPGVGKSALLEQLIRSAGEFQIVRAVGVEGEIDLPYAGLHQLCRSMLDRIDVLPQPQADALRLAFGLASGQAADRYLVGLAALGLLSEMAATKPLLCVVDDAQWLDRPTTHALAFVARRLGADSVALLIASRSRVDELDDVPTLELDGLATADARRLLDSALVGRLDGTLRERFLAETRGNPLALLELPYTLTPAEAASGIFRKKGGSLAARIEDSFRKRVKLLPEDTRLLLLLAAAEPVGDPLLLLRAAGYLGLPVEAVDAAVDAELLEVRQRWTFRHPLVRSAAYRSASERERRRAHGALAEVTDGDVDADRKAWHRAQATAVPDEEIAAALEQTAAHAKARGGLAAAGTFLERAAQLTPDAHRRIERALAAAEMLLEAGAFESVQNLLRAIDASGVTELQDARAEWMRAQAKLEREEGDAQEAFAQLLGAADRLTRFDRELGQAARLGAFRWVWLLGAEAVRALVAALDSAPGSDRGSPTELAVRGLDKLFAEGFPAGTDELRTAMVAFGDAQDLHESDLYVLDLIVGIAQSEFELEAGERLCRRGVELARSVGALSRLPQLLMLWAEWKAHAGDLRSAEALIGEADAVSEAIGQPRCDATFHDALAYDCDEALRRIDEYQRHDAEGPVDDWRATALLGAGRYEAALEVAQRAIDVHPVGGTARALVCLVEAARRCGDLDRARAAFEPLAARTQHSGTDWALGIEARCRALVSDGDVAETCYREAVERLARAGTRPELARAHLLYGEWLRREGRRSNAREQLRTAHELFETIGMPSFAERARRELVATGETARKRSEETRVDLTSQEAQIARLAAQGATNAQIGAQLFLSPRTVEWHLRHVFPKLGITSRRELWSAFAGGASSGGSR